MNSTIKATLVRLHSLLFHFSSEAIKSGGLMDCWNTYAIVAIIELARREAQNPDVPQWVASDYFQSIRQLAEIGTTEVLRAESADEIRSILSIIAIEKGLRTHGRFLVSYSEDELLDLESRF